MGNLVLTPQDLLTVAGVTAATVLVMQLFFKTLLQNLVSGGKLPDKWYPVVMNVLTFAVAAFFVALGMFALGALSRLEAVQGFLTALIATSLSIGSYEFSKNLGKLV